MILKSPRFYLLILAIISGIVLFQYGQILDEFWKAVCGTMVSGFIFSIFMDLLPSTLKEMKAYSVILKECDSVLGVPATFVAKFTVWSQILLPNHKFPHLAN